MPRSQFRPLFTLLLPVAFCLSQRVYAQRAAPGGSAMCAACHPKIAETYARTGMARSFYRPDSLQPARFYHAPSSTWYSIERKDSVYIQRRWRVGYDGNDVDEMESPVDYVMGSGNHVRTFLSRTERGSLVELPLAWYAEKGGYWAMNPGHDRPYALPARTVAYECMGCHNAYPPIPPGHDEPGSEPLYDKELPEGIDCQRCHGPGASHIQAARIAGTAVDDIRKAILNPARLGRDRQLEICYQCHLETTSKPLPRSIQKFGRAPFSWNPAEPLGNYQIFFDRAAKSASDEEFEIAHSAYRLRKSKCFLSSAMTCTTCHNPHDIPRGEEATAHYNGVCAQCHAAPFRQQVAAGKHTEAADCVTCHMPKRRATDVVHAVVTDHLIRRTPATGDLIAPLAERNDKPGNALRSGNAVPYYPSPLPSTPENALYTAIAAGSAPRLAAEVLKQKPARPEFYLELGQAWIGAGNPRNAVAAFEEAVKREPNSPVATLNLADALTRAGQQDRALEVLNRAVAAAPEEALLWYQLGLAHSAADRAPQAISALQKATTLDPLLADAWTVLGTSLAAKEDMPEAESAFRSALRAEPDQPDALGNLAHLLSATGRLPEAAYYFTRALRIKPDDPDVRVNYSVTLAGLGRFEEAMVQAEAAVKAYADSPDAHNFMGTLLLRANRPDDALREFLEATRLRPAFGLAHLNAAGVLLSRGDKTAALIHLRQAARDSDPTIRDRALQLIK